MADKIDTLNPAAHKWIASRVDSTKTRWALIGLAFLQAALNVLMAGELIRMYRKDQARPPYVVRIDGERPSAIPAADLAYTPQEREVRFHLGRWARLYYSRIHGLTAVDQKEAFMYFQDAFAKAMSAKNYPELAAFVKARDAEEAEVVYPPKNIISRLETEPYSAEIHFVKLIQTQAKSEIRRENWTVEVRFRFAKEVPNSLQPYNPLGLQIEYLYASQGW